MKLSKSQLVTVSFMLFSMFFGAGNLIFPPFLGQNAGSATFTATLGFVITAVILPVLGVIVVAQFDGLDKLGGKVGGGFAVVFTLLIYLSIGPGLGIPRAASVPFEMAVAPYLPQGASFGLWMLVYSLVFFVTACWLALNPGKLLDRIGHFLTPALLILLMFLFIAFVANGEKAVALPQEAYMTSPFLKGFCEGYQTMDTIAALNFGLVIATTLVNLGVDSKKGVIGHTVVCGIAAGSILTVIYCMLTYMGMQSSGVYEIGENGAQALRQIVYQIFGQPGAILLAAIFTLACLTTCVGLINSISRYFSTFFKKLSYRRWVYTICLFAFVICNQGLTTILGISVPILNAIYPVSIVLIVLGLSDRFIGGNRYIYPMTIWGTAAVSVLSVLDSFGLPMGFINTACRALPFYDLGFGWVSVAIVMLICAVVTDKVKAK